MMDIGVIVALLSLTSGLLVGFSLGLLGGGGSILAVPLLVYVVGVHDTPFKKAELKAPSGKHSKHYHPNS